MHTAGCRTSESLTFPSKYLTFSTAQYPMYILTPYTTVYPWRNQEHSTVCFFSHLKIQLLQFGGSHTMGHCVAFCGKTPKWGILGSGICRWISCRNGFWNDQPEKRHLTFFRHPKYIHFNTKGISRIWASQKSSQGLHLHQRQIKPKRNIILVCLHEKSWKSGSLAWKIFVAANLIVLKAGRLSFIVEYIMYGICD